MEQPEIRQQTQAIINELLTYSSAQIFDIAPAEQKLKNLSQQAPEAIEPLIGLILANIMLGNRKIALELSDKVWQIGGELSDFFERIYADNLINLGDADRANILLADRFGYLQPNLKEFYAVLVRCALLTGKLSILKEMADYEGIYDREPVLFDFASSHAFNFSLKDYRAVLQILQDNLADCLCAFDYNLYPYQGLQLLYYTSLEPAQNEERTRLIKQKMEGYFLSMQQPEIEDLFFNLLNIKQHPIWQNDTKA